MSLESIKSALLTSYRSHGGTNHLDGMHLPSQESVNWLAADCMHLLFPGFFEERTLTEAELPVHVQTLLERIQRRLVAEIEKCLRFAHQEAPAASAAALTETFLARLPEVRSIVATDVEAAYAGDPAARSLEEIVLAYPCVLVISVQRLAHELYRLGVPLLPRMLTEYAHERTGCDIHPGARLGTHFFIDHATGVVIGETATVGNHVKLYQGVTLGAKSFALDHEGNPIKGVKRHPDLGNHVTVYAHATILGGDTRIGDHAIIGSNVWLLRSVPANSVAAFKGDQLVVRSRRQHEALEGRIEAGGAAADFSI